jgi:hypothetical protein
MVSSFFVGFAFVLSLVVLLAVCSNRRHGWFCALTDLLGLATSTGVSPLFVVEDGKCMFNACLLSLNSPRAADELIQDCVNFLSNAGPNDTDLSAIVPTLPNPIVWNEASVLDVMPVVLSKVLRAEILIISKLAGGNPTINRVTNTSVPTSTRIVLLHILNTLVVPQIYHYLGTRVLSSGESATLPDVYRCLSAQPDLCEYATIRTDPHPLLVPVYGEHDELGFEYATLYNHVLCGPGSEMQFLVGDTPMQGLGPALRFRNGTCYYFHPMTRSELSVGRNWRLAVLHQASLLAMNFTHWDRGTLVASAPADVRQSFQDACASGCEMVKAAVSADPTLVRFIEELRERIVAYDQLSLLSPPQVGFANRCDGFGDTLF